MKDGLAQPAVISNRAGAVALVSAVLVWGLLVGFSLARRELLFAVIASIPFVVTAVIVSLSLLRRGQVVIRYRGEYAVVDGGYAVQGQIYTINKVFPKEERSQEKALYIKCDLLVGDGGGIEKKLVAPVPREWYVDMKSRGL